MITLVWSVVLGLIALFALLIVHDLVMPVVHEVLDLMWLHRQNARRDLTFRPRTVEALRTLAPPVRSAPAGAPCTPPAGAPSGWAAGKSPDLRPSLQAPVDADVVATAASTGLQLAARHG